MSDRSCIAEYIHDRTGFAIVPFGCCSTSMNSPNFPAGYDGCRTTGQICLVSTTPITATEAQHRFVPRWNVNSQRLKLSLPVARFSYYACHVRWAIASIRSAYSFATDRMAVWLP